MNVCTASGLNNLGRSLGLSQTTGYSPYLPLLALAIATKWFHLCQINPLFHFITAGWFVLVLTLLTITDLIVDLIPAVSTGWHAVHTAITPFLGGFVAIATSPSFSLPGISTSIPPDAPLHLAFLAQLNSLSISGTASTIVLFLAGFLLAGFVQLHRTGGRAIANVGHVFTLGLSNIIISIGEDIAAVISIILSFLAPVVMLIIVILVVLFLLVTFKFIKRGWRFFTGWARQQ